MINICLIESQPVMNLCNCRRIKHACIVWQSPCINTCSYKYYSYIPIIRCLLNKAHFCECSARTLYTNTQTKQPTHNVDKKEYMCDHNYQNIGFRTVFITRITLHIYVCVCGSQFACIK